uniref:MBD domain-containing protein n=1 Tax=Chenopodium quinoa TaxID=63459 RepID=A0A803KRX4_CHEQI
MEEVVQYLAKEAMKPVSPVPRRTKRKLNDKVEEQIPAEENESPVIVNPPQDWPDWLPQDCFTVVLNGRDIILNDDFIVDLARGIRLAFYAANPGASMTKETSKTDSFFNFETLDSIKREIMMQRGSSSTTIPATTQKTTPPLSNAPIANPNPVEQAPNPIQIQLNEPYVSTFLPMDSSLSQPNGTVVVNPITLPIQVAPMQPFSNPISSFQVVAPFQMNATVTYGNLISAHAIAPAYQQNHINNPCANLCWQVRQEAIFVDEPATNLCLSTPIQEAPIQDAPPIATPINVPPPRRRGRKEKPTGLPDTWIVTQTTRKSGKTKGVVDKTYKSPDGKYFRSWKTAIVHYRNTDGKDDKGEGGSSSGGQAAA